MVTSFTFEPVLTREFIRFGHDLYHGDAGWIPPVRKDLAAQLSPGYPFYRKPGNRHNHFIARRGGEVVGRISAMVNAALKDRDGTPVSTVGFFECREDDAVARDLFDAAVAWLREECRATRIWGPMNFDIWHAYRLMIRGFERKPFYGEPTNKPYYPRLFDQNGFVARHFWDTVELEGRQLLGRMAARYQDRYHVLTGLGYRFVTFDTRRFRQEMGTLHSVLCRSFEGFPGFTPIPRAEFEELFGERARFALHPRLFCFVYDEKSVLAGFAAAFLELSDAVRALSGSGRLMGMLRFLRRRRRADSINFYIIGITPEEAAKRRGLGGAMFSFVMRNILEEGFERVIVPLMARGNVAHRLLAGDAPLPSREYALYEYNA
ncbi:MAG: hypothetical protein MUC41_05320 [Syntrophobacteraceae bacterium]|nr:hypothetical protein [Syntrophobacteraceae bacterium]